jgi:hypothetical protein
MGRVCGSTHGEIRYIYKIFVVKPEERRALRTPMHKWEDNIRMDVWEIW